MAAAQPLAAALVALLAVACSGERPKTSAVYTHSGPPLSIVATSNIVADWARHVGGDRVTVFSLLPIGADPHSFQPGTRDVVRVADADLVLTVGLDLEAAWLTELVNSAAAQPDRVVVLGEAIDALEFADKPGRLYARPQGPPDPHFWFDPMRVKRAVSDIAARLSALDPDGARTYGANAETYNQELDELDTWIREQVDQVPPDRRLLVTSHDSFQYLADRYGLTVVGAVFPDFTTEREPSPSELAELVTQMRETAVGAVLTETTVSDRLAQAVARETGATVVNGLYTGSLGRPGSGAETYVEMMRADVTEIVHALR